MTQKVRINKFLADSGINSRRKSENFILDGRVAVNDKVITSLSYKIDIERDTVTLDGEKIKPKKNIYLLLNKPKGYITTVFDDRNRRTVMELIKVKEKIYPVGRLDYNTTGLLILTNDGDFSQLLTHPGNRIPREYEIKLDKPLEKIDKEKLLNGVLLDGKRGKFLSVSSNKGKDNKFLTIKCEEGRNRFVKRMFGKLEYRVEELMRIKYADIELNVPQGAYRIITPHEVQKIKEKYSS